MYAHCPDFLPKKKLLLPVQSNMTLLFPVSFLCYHPSLCRVSWTPVSSRPSRWPWGIVVGSNAPLPPPKMPTPTLGPVNITSHGKGDAAVVISGSWDGEMMHLGPKSPLPSAREKQENQRQGGHVSTEAVVRVMWARGPRNATASSRWTGWGDRFSPGASGRNTALQPRFTHLSPRAVGELVCVSKSIWVCGDLLQQQ